MLAERRNTQMNERKGPDGQTLGMSPRGGGRARVMAASRGNVSVGEAAGPRHHLTLAGRHAGTPLRSARREQVGHTPCKIAVGWLSKRYPSTQSPRGTKPQAAAAAPSPVDSRGDAVLGAGCRHVVVVGDSVAAGRGDPVPGLALVGWADRLAVALRSHGTGNRLTNLAQCGLSTAEIMRTQLGTAVALRPHLIVVIAGGNDLLAPGWDPDTFRLAYRSLLEQLSAGGAIVLTMTWHEVPLAVPMPPRFARRFSHRLGEASAVVRELSRELGALCLDFWHMPELLDAGCYSRDGIHPNARGYLRVADVIADGLSHHAGLPVPRSALRSPAERQLGHIGEASTRAEHTI
jgi:lysophospholipase L1-like esterase